MDFTRTDTGSPRADGPHMNLRGRRDRMRIVLDARQVFRPQRRGIGKTLINLYAVLAERRPGWQFTLLHQLDADVPELKTFANLSKTRIDFYGLNRFDLWEQAVLPMTALAARADVLHAPANTGPKRSSVPVVINIHDLIPLEMAPESEETRLWLSQVKTGAERARHIITGSQYSKGRLMSVLGIPESKITVNYWAPDRNIAKIDDVMELNAIRTKYGLHANEPYAFAFGASDPRKNTARLIRAYARMPERLRQNFRFLIVGIQAESLAGFREQAAALGVADRVVLHGFIPEEDLSGLLSGAEMLAFPSRYEGFGLPIIDAFLCGTAVLTGNRTSLPEVAGDAAILVDSESDEALTEAMSRMLDDESLRRDLVQKGLIRSELFHWNHTADTVAGVFEAVANGGAT
jgi:glycosyltransferase involved in cell wall biosynthesis